MNALTNKEALDCFEYVLAVVRKWQEEGRSGFSLPVLKGESLNRLEAVSDAWVRDKCSWCHGTGKLGDGYDEWDCAHCEPLSFELEDEP